MILLLITNKSSLILLFPVKKLFKFGVLIACALVIFWWNTPSFSCNLYVIVLESLIHVSTSQLVKYICLICSTYLCRSKWGCLSHVYWSPALRSSFSLKSSSDHSPSTKHGKWVMFVKTAFIHIRNRKFKLLKTF